MRVISNRSLPDFAAIHPAAAKPLQAWRKIIEANAFSNYADLKAVFNATDRVGAYYIFDIGDNKYRIIASIHLNTQKLFVRHVFTHKEYDAWDA
ncbi:type II toxin-antitoxin system HigB family toxin [Methylobacterium currus]|jgi:mRNA interferase HigB|uniref:Type II toxin-antitoxin system HigB family toxin n=1 Tax=Methylobacterium currus TaxID=2051553 RepID=A0A2R4WJF8_9HYPH|nr:type II toxin-antitoxin system HigB family toxin [Methylobacterium currus]AWB21683.1 type II toxin-antitoxin system HigB family toxin [Methylobacterium currus]UHC18695.1 type II toxin-antitoxin system HigB family toxin [Methylobacterium currus]